MSTCVMYVCAWTHMFQHVQSTYAGTCRRKLPVNISSTTTCDDVISYYRTLWQTFHILPIHPLTQTHKHTATLYPDSQPQVISIWRFSSHFHGFFLTSNSFPAILSTYHQPLAASLILSPLAASLINYHQPLAASLINYHQPLAASLILSPTTGCISYRVI